jgi:hypothetical protein
LEERAVPAAASPFFLDTNHQLWANTAAAGELPSFINTGGFGLQLSVGEINTSDGTQFAAVRDGNNRVWIFNGNNGVFTDTGIFAVDLAAGRGEVFLRDGKNQIWVLSLGSLNADGTFAVGATETTGFAQQMSVGFDTTL